MRTFREQLVESNMADMPKGLLHAKTVSILGEHGYQEHVDGSRIASEESGERRRTMHHKVDNDHADHLDNEWNGDVEHQDGTEYIENGPDHLKIHRKLAELGWQHMPHHGMYHALGDERVINTDVYQHPNGATMTHMAHHDAGVSNHYWHLR